MKNVSRTHTMSLLPADLCARFFTKPARFFAGLVLHAYYYYYYYEFTRPQYV
ncbi:MAG TPA: hypothetical protein PLU75_08990 [Oscillospiraceae bacterium]|jgi:hypothetical protein|nr:hypothetical protein [Oscillospiraceae bacterium]HRW57433.1 hypothetical protein [Oscillospiraceae bacterium]